MIAPLRSTVVPISVSVFAGIVVILGLALGLVLWQLFAVAALIGVVVGAPLGIWVSRRMRRTPPIERPASPAMDPEAARRAVTDDHPAPYPAAVDQVYRN